MSSFLSILGKLGSIFLAVINYFHDRSVRTAEDQKIQVNTLKGELADVTKAKNADDRVDDYLQSHPDGLPDDDPNRRD